MGGDEMTRPLTLSAFSGATVIRYESAGTAVHIDEREAARRVGHGGVKFRAMPGDVTGTDVDRFLYACLGIDPHRFVFDLPSTVRGTGATRTGHGGAKPGDREGFVFQRGTDGRAAGSPIGKVIFLTSDRRFREGDPESRGDFEALR